MVARLGQRSFYTQGLCLNITMININSQHSPKCDLISFGLFGCFLSLHFFGTEINVKCKLY